VSFSWKGDSNERIQYGVIAQEVEAVLGVDAEKYGIVFRDGEKYYGTDSNDTTEIRKVDYYQLISPVIRSIQELSSRVNALEEKTGIRKDGK
jgi:hypothetical protein